ncbi:hypothetical protein H3C61_03055 [Candidatus Gracilibacteria bacterium]|nr:hypothetical protein [Candidatus Gracilibacteria bacterium]
MEIKLQIQATDESRSAVERLARENLDKKLKSYLNKFDREDVVGNISIKIDKDKKGLFVGKLQISIDGHNYYYEREDYKNLDDLVNNLFDHFKLDLSSK